MSRKLVLNCTTSQPEFKTLAILNYNLLLCGSCISGGGERNVQEDGDVIFRNE